MDGFSNSDYDTEHQEYSKRKLALWTSQTVESDDIRKHEGLGRAKIEREGNSSQALNTLHMQTEERLLGVQERFRRMEEELDRRWEVIKGGIQGGVSWAKADALERIGSTAKRARKRSHVESSGDYYHPGTSMSPVVKKGSQRTSNNDPGLPDAYSIDYANDSGNAASLDWCPGISQQGPSHLGSRYSSSVRPQPKTAPPRTRTPARKPSIARSRTPALRPQPAPAPSLPSPLTQPPPSWALSTSTLNLTSTESTRLDLNISRAVSSPLASKFWAMLPREKWPAVYERIWMFVERRLGDARLVGYAYRVPDFMELCARVVEFVLEEVGEYEMEKKVETEAEAGLSGVGA